MSGKLGANTVLYTEVIELQRLIGAGLLGGQSRDGIWQGGSKCGTGWSRLGSGAAGLVGHGGGWGGGERGGREGRVAKWQSARAGWKDWYGLFS